MFLQVKNKMREGMLLFTNYTNRWKGRELVQKARAQIAQADSLSFEEIKVAASKLHLTSVTSRLKGKQYKPSLPMPSQSTSNMGRISYSKPHDEIDQVADYLEVDGKTPSVVGEKCFDVLLSEARRR